MKKRTSTKKGGTPQGFTFGVQPSTPGISFGVQPSTPGISFGVPTTTPGISFGVPTTTSGISFGTQPTFGTGSPIQLDEWKQTKNKKELDNFVIEYDFRVHFDVEKTNDTQVATSETDRDIYLFRGINKFCDQIDFKQNNMIWLSNFNVAKTYAYGNGSVVGYKVTKKPLELFVLSDIENIRKLLDFCKDDTTKTNVIKLATGVDCKDGEQEALYNAEFKGFMKWYPPQKTVPINRVGVTSTDKNLVEIIKAYCLNKNLTIDGYYADELFTTMTAEHKFHEEILLFSPENCLKEDRNKSFCTFVDRENSANLGWGGKKGKQQRKTPSKGNTKPKTTRKPAPKKATNTKVKSK